MNSSNAHEIKSPSSQSKAETARSHRSLDKLSANRALISPELSFSACRDFLCAIDDVWSPLEMTLEALWAEGFEDNFSGAVRAFYLRRRDALARDLAEIEPSRINLTQSPSEIDQMPSSIQPFGRLHVLLGAQLGSLHIERNIAAQLPNAPLAFFKLRFAYLSLQWRQFTSFFYEVVVDERAQQDLVESANVTYRCFYERMK